MFGDKTSFLFIALTFLKTFFQDRTHYIMLSKMDTLELLNSGTSFKETSKLQKKWLDGVHDKTILLSKSYEGGTKSRFRSALHLCSENALCSQPYVKIG